MFLKTTRSFAQVAKHWNVAILCHFKISFPRTHGVKTSEDIWEGFVHSRASCRLSLEAELREVLSEFLMGSKVACSTVGSCTYKVM